VGRKKAGRRLDRRVWNQVPVPAGGVAERPSRSRRAIPLPITAPQRKKRVRSTESVAANVGVTPAQARAVKAHMTMGTYG